MVIVIHLGGNGGTVQFQGVIDNIQSLNVALSRPPSIVFMLQHYCSNQIICPLKWLPVCALAYIDNAS